MPLDLPPDDRPCPFCGYLAGTQRYTILDRDDRVALLVTFEQRGLGHVLVIPVAHRVTILDVRPDEHAPLLEGVARTTAAIVGAYDPPGVAVWQNNGRPAHQTVPHVHVHVAGTLPGGGTEWGEVERLPFDATDAIADRLRPHLPPRC